MSDGDAYVWGDNTCQVLGLTTSVSARKRPFPVAKLNKEHPSGYTRLLPKCQIVVAGGVHSVAVTVEGDIYTCLLYTSPSPRDRSLSRMPSSA